MVYARHLMTALFLCWATAGMLWAQDNYELEARLFDEDRGDVEVQYPWKYQSGDDMSWAGPRFDDRAWATVRSTLRMETMEAQHWSGIGWFRLHLEREEDLQGVPLGLILEPYGAAEVYVDGTLVHRYGQVSNEPTQEVRAQDPLVKAIPATRSGRHVIAVRISNTKGQAYRQADALLGFRLWVGRADQMVTYVDHHRRAQTVAPMFFMGLFLALGLLHLILYFSYRRRTGNLYLALTSIALLGVAILDHGELFFATPDRELWTPLALASTMVVGSITGLRLTYAVFISRLPYFFYGVLLTGLVLLAWPFVIGEPIYQALLIFGLLLYVEHVRTVIVAEYRHKPGSRLLGIGTIVFSLGLGYLLLLQLEIIPSLGGEALMPYVMGAVLLLAYAIHLNRIHAKETGTLRSDLAALKENTRVTMEEDRRSRADELRRMLLENEMQRKVQALEQARDVQRSMLPKKLPRHPRFDLAAGLKSAAESSGDYYDVDLGRDGTLTVVVGDATGHAMQANAVIAVAKSLYTVFGREPRLVSIFDKITRVLYRINLDRLFLGMTIARFEGRELRLVSTSMPPTLIYRAANSLIEHVSPSGLPLGESSGATYEERIVKLEPGDTVLLLTDGLPKRINEHGEELGFEQVINFFGAVAESSTPQTVIEALSNESDRWAGALPPHDDMTFVVVRVKE